VLDAIQTDSATYVPIRDELLGLIAQDSVLESQLTLVKDSLLADNTAYNGVIDEMESGLILLDTAYNETSGTFITYEDSISNYKFPLEMNPPGEDTGEVIYTFIIDSQEYQLHLTYSKFESVDEKRNVYVRVMDIQVLSTSFLSTEVICTNESCLENETTIICNF
jgi:hypothetical protein